MSRKHQIKAELKAFTAKERASDDARWARRERKEQKEIDDFNRAWASVLGNDNHNIG